MRKVAVRTQPSLIRRLERISELETSPTAPELIAACEAGDRARISSLVSSIPIQAWTVIPGQAMVRLEPLRVLVWLEAGGSEINTCETVILQLFVDGENARHLSYRFSADELQLPNYNRLLIDLCRRLQKQTDKGGVSGQS
jgi:hypothetical protein